MKKCWILCILLFSVTGYAAGVLNVYTWDSYFPSAVVKDFEKNTGIIVHLSYFDNNEVLYTKLKIDPHLGYDVIVPSSYYVQRMAKEGMLKHLDLRRVPNAKTIFPALMNRRYDPHNEYSLPYVWGATGMVVDDRYWNPKTVTRWRDFWQPRFKNQLLLLDDYREVFGIALLRLGYSVNDRNPEHIKKAYLLLRKLMPNIRLFNSNSNFITSLYADQDATVGAGWNGDVYLSLVDNHHLHFVYPKSGYSEWVDCLAIPKYAPHVANAYRFLNYINDPRHAAKIAKYIGYATPNAIAAQHLPKAMRQNNLLYPSEAVIKRGQIQQDLGSARQIYLKYWQIGRASCRERV